MTGAYAGDPETVADVVLPVAETAVRRATHAASGWRRPRSAVARRLRATSSALPGQYRDRDGKSSVWDPFSTSAVARTGYRPPENIWASGENGTQEARPAGRADGRRPVDGRSSRNGDGSSGSVPRDLREPEYGVFTRETGSPSRIWPFGRRRARIAYDAKANIYYIVVNGHGCVRRSSYTGRRWG